MSLDISAWVPDRDAYAGRGRVEDPPGTSTGVGAENLRYTLWGSDEDRILSYLANMRSAISRAEEVGGGVIIW
jgi:hypothetical protein